jgi:hypothetical protein
VISVNNDAYPAVAVASGKTVQDAIAWVRENDTPLVFPDHGPQYPQFQVAYPDASGSVPIFNLTHVKDEGLAVQHARRYLTGSVQRYQEQ